LLDSLREYVTRFVVLPSDEAADLLALWTLHTHAIDAAQATPYLRITSATPSSGKTLLLEVLGALCARGWHAVNPSTAVLYRKIDQDGPTLLLDEMDNYPLSDRRDALSVLNNGYRRGARVDRVGDGGKLESFSCFCPKAYAGLDVRDLPPALLSRSVTVRMEAKLSREQVERWPGAWAEADADPAPLREACATWAEANVEALRAIRPTLPPGLGDRSAEVWRALLALAEHAGADWPDRARRAANVLSAGGDAADALSEPVQLLADVRAAFESNGTAMLTADLLTFLNGLDESPWGARRRGEGLDARGLARMLRKFQTSEGAPIRPGSIRTGTGPTKGYRWDQFTDTFERYLPHPASPAKPAKSSPDAERVSPDSPDSPGNGQGRFVCSCGTPGLPAEDGRCSRCYGWPEVEQ
jgi:Protein of unknown function (DUF3631)